MGQPIPEDTNAVVENTDTASVSSTNDSADAEESTAEDALLNLDDSHYTYLFWMGDADYLKIDCFKQIK